VAAARVQQTGVAVAVAEQDEILAERADLSGHVGGVCHQADRVLRYAGLSSVEFGLVTSLGRRPPMGVARLAEAVGVDKGQIRALAGWSRASWWPGRSIPGIALRCWSA
jgi:hypothetical protein